MPPEPILHPDHNRGFLHYAPAKNEVKRIDAIAPIVISAREFPVSYPPAEVCPFSLAKTLPSPSLREDDTLRWAEPPKEILAPASRYNGTWLKRNHSA
jgi:hypothetical protein